VYGLPTEHELVRGGKKWYMGTGKKKLRRPKLKFGKESNFELFRESNKM